MASVVVSLTLAYNGAPFSGFAAQPNQLTVQGSLEEALELLFRRHIETTCAGRTDAGVHALNQVVSFALDAGEWSERSPKKLLRSLNALTPEAMMVKDVSQQDADFSARFSARSREYRYFICTDTVPPLLMRSFSWHTARELDLEALKEAAKFLVGEHDFKSFCTAASAEGRPTSRYVASIDFWEENLWDSHFVVVRVVGNAFLHSMVRTLVGTLVEVGLGKRGPAWVDEVLKACDRRAAGQTAPAQGLVFWRANYDGPVYYSEDER